MAKIKTCDSRNSSGGSFNKYFRTSQPKISAGNTDDLIDNPAGSCQAFDNLKEV